MSVINDSGLLYRTAYFTLPRLAIEAMPSQWQQRFVDLMNEAYEQHGMETPAYHVLRADAEYTSVTLDDPDDETSWEREFYCLRHDPWANYRHGRIDELCPSFKKGPV